MIETREESNQKKIEEVISCLDNRLCTYNCNRPGIYTYSGIYFCADHIEVLFCENCTDHPSIRAKAVTVRKGIPLCSVCAAKKKK